MPSNGVNGLVTADLLGVAVAAPVPQAQLTPSSRDYGDVVVGQAKARNFTLTNVGDADLVVSSVDKTGSAWFSVSVDGCTGDTLAPTESCVIEVTFTPTDPEHKDGTITVNSNADDVTSTFEGDGVDPAAVHPVALVTPDEYDFGDVLVDDHEDHDFTLENNGTGTLTGIVLSKTGGSFDIQAEDCPASLAAGDDCTITIRFLPTSVGDKSGTLRVASDNASNGTVTVPLSGTGEALPAFVTVSPDDYDFGPVERGTSKSKTFTFSNTGGTSVHVVSVEKVSGSNTFTIPAAHDGCTGADVGAGESCSFRVTFNAPITNNSKNAVIEVSGSGFAPVSVPVHGQSVPFTAKVDASISKTTDTPSEYVGVGLFCSAVCTQQTVYKNTQGGHWAVYRLRVKNVGNGRDSFKLRLTQGGSKSIVQDIKVLRNGNQDVTAQVTNAGYVIRDVNPGSDAYFWVKVKIKSGATLGKSNGMILTAQSQRQTAVKDTNQARTKVVN